MEPAEGLALLHITLPDGSEQVVPVMRSPYNIGRVETNDLPLSHQMVSRNHARLLFQGEEMVLIDLNSSNGTFVGEQRLAPSEPHPLSYGDAFSIGPYKLWLEAIPAAAVRARPAAEEAPAAAEAPPPEETEARRPQRRRAAPPPRPPEPPPPAAPVVPYDDAFGIPRDESRYLEYLPPIYEQDPFLGRFLLAFEGVLAPIEQTVDSFDLYLDPKTAPPHFLEQLAAWLGLTLDEKWPLQKRRAVLAEAAELYRLRGTRRGLSRHLQIYTDVEPEITEPEGRPFHFVVRLRVKRDQQVDRATVERIIEANKPAHTTYSLEIVSG
ncbi:MAG: FHA domain-containing protein [Anaerolineae bacterium]|nr:FHA domain-containing protein [Anaerolineae bacterium]